MTVSGEEFSRRLEGYSDDTIRLLSSFDQVSREAALKALEIAAETDTEEEVLEKLKVLEEQNKGPILPVTEEERQEIKRKAKEEYLKQKGKL